MKYVAISQFFRILEEEKESSCLFCEKNKYKNWTDDKSNLVKYLENLGPLEGQQQAIARNNTKEISQNFWEKKLLFVNYYPCNGSDILKCNNCGAIFFNYIELGGHGPHSMLVWIRKSILDFSD